MAVKEDPRIRRTKHSFEIALLTLLKDYDYEKITVRKIAEIAKLNRATFYLHYQDKEDLLEQYLTKSLEELKTETKIHKNELQYKYSEPHPLFIRMFEHIQKKEKFYKIMLLQHENPKIIFSLRQIILSFIKQAEYYMMKDGIEFVVPTNIREAYITSAYLGIIMWWLEHNMPYSPTHMATQLTIISTLGPYKSHSFYKHNKKAGSKQN